MENIEISKYEKNMQHIDSSFEEDIHEINDIFKNKSSQNFDFNFNEEKIMIEKENSQNIFNNKIFEENDLSEIYDFLNEINKAENIDLNTLNKEENYNNNKKYAYSQHNSNIINDDHFNECQEILSILKKPLSNKNLRNRNINDTPFKPLLKPKKVSLEGKILCYTPSENNTTECESKINN